GECSQLPPVCVSSNWSLAELHVTFAVVAFDLVLVQAARTPPANARRQAARRIPVKLRKRRVDCMGAPVARRGGAMRYRLTKQMPAGRKTYAVEATGPFATSVQETGRAVAGSELPAAGRSAHNAGSSTPGIRRHERRPETHRQRLRSRDPEA